MAAGIYNFTIEQGTTFKRTFKYKDSTGTAISLESHAIRMQVRKTVESSTVELSITETSGNGTPATVFDVSTTNTNEFDLIISKEDTAAMSFNTAVYDIEIQDASGNVTRLLQGKIKLSKEVTRG